MKVEKRYKKAIFLFTIILFLTILPLVSSIPPVQISQSSESLEIAYPQYQYISLGEGFDLYIHVYNNTNYITGSKANCYLDIYNSTGVESMSEIMNAGGADYYVSIDSGNFSDLGLHPFIIQCNTTSQVGFASGVFEVSNSGFELTIGRAMIDLGLLFILLIFIIGCVILVVRNDNLLSKVGFIGLGYILLIAITFISWNMANDFLFSAPIIVSIFRIMFLTLMIGAFPLLIGAFAWYLIMLFKIKEIEDLMTKGFTFEEAERRHGRRNK